MQSGSFNMYRIAEPLFNPNPPKRVSTDPAPSNQSTNQPTICERFRARMTLWKAFLRKNAIQTVITMVFLSAAVALWFTRIIGKFLGLKELFLWTLTACCAASVTFVFYWMLMPVATPCLAEEDGSPQEPR